MNKTEELVVRIVELRGNYYQFGLEQGREFLSFQSLEQLDQLKALTENANIEHAKKKIKATSPHLFQELTGLATGLDMELEEAIKVFSGYDVVFPAMGCTTFVTDGYYARNYDFSPEMYDARLVFTKPIDGYASVGFSHQIIGRLDGMNEKGLVVGLHFVNNEHSEEGFIATTIVRMLLEQCATIEEAIHFLTTIPHGYCYNYSITEQSGKSIKVEASPQQQIIHPSNPLICTNHFESETLTDKNRRQIQGSIQRKEYLKTLLVEKLTPQSAYHHFNHENSPLFFKDYKEYFGTLHTVIYQPEKLSLMIGVGQNSEPTVFSLKEYMEGRFTLPECIKGKISQSR